MNVPVKLVGWLVGQRQEDVEQHMCLWCGLLLGWMDGVTGWFLGRLMELCWPC